MMAAPYTIRLPSKFAPASAASAFAPPTPAWLEGTWFVTHTSLPLWRGKRNVTLTYTRIPPDTPEGIEKLDDVAAHQTMTDPKVKTVHGVDTPSPGVPGAWDWRGKGWLAIASSHWEVLGFGDLAGENQWVVTYFAKTLFTPAGIDVYSRRKEGLPEEAVRGIMEALEGLEVRELKELVQSSYDVVRN